MRKLVLTLVLTLAAGAAVADDVAVTVYNSNLGVVSETRPLTFTKGNGEIDFTDVPKLIDASSVRFETVRGGDIAILEQNYLYDLVNPYDLFYRYIDQPVEFVDEDGNVFSGTLLAYDRSSATLQTPVGGVQFFQMDNVARTNFPKLPDGFITRPTLRWRYTAEQTGTFDCRVSYQTGGLGWKAEYVGILNAAETDLGLSGWADITNNSGKSYTDATLKLVAGDIARANQATQYDRFSPGIALMEKAGDAGFEEKAFFEYHLYTLPREATLVNNQSKQISLFEPASTRVNKVYRYQPDRNDRDVSVAIKFENRKANGLGMPLPEGRVRLFKADTDGSMILLGEDAIEHTPENEEVSLQVGNAFDIIGKHITRSQNRVSQNVEDQEFELTLTNRKKEPVTVEVVRTLYGNWQITQAPFEYTRKDAQTIEFKLDVPADGKTTVTYTVRFTYR